MNATRPSAPRLGHRGLIVPLAVAVLLLGACGASGGDAGSGQAQGPASPQEQIDTVERVSVDGRQRSYRLFVPATATGPAPVVVVLHDAGGDLETIVNVTGFDRAAAGGGFAVAYPEGAVQGTWNAGFCCGPAPATGIDDIGFLNRVVGQVADHPRIDADRVYVAGVSNGAVLAYRYACEHPEAIAGVASVAGAMLLEDCQPTTAVSVLEIHGTADGIVPFEGGRLPDFTQATSPVPAAPEMMSHWAELNGCSDRTARSEGLVTTTTWQGCEDATSVRLVAIEGAGHTWYASEFGPTEGAVDATGTIIDFFDLAASP